ncbi:MAG: M14 family metallopeptidase [Saprospiraceae bacterium]
MKFFTACILTLLVARIQAQPYQTVFESSHGSETPTYPQIIQWWSALSKNAPNIQMKVMGMTDAGMPLHLVTISGDKEFGYNQNHKKGKVVILINNGIHPGEPDGIDASMLLARDIVTHKLTLPSNIVLAIIPVYNIGGCLDRSSDYRVDQNGPDEFGFRGNSQNLDLNRDFIKCDSREAISFAEIFHLVDPDIFVDNHVSNGADYQHVMTLIATQHDKLGGAMGTYLNEVFEPALYASMKLKGLDLIPYVNAFGDKPENGWPQFMDWPRYGSGYAALWSTFSFIPESHMLKPYDQRVHATYELMKTFIDFATTHGPEIKQVRAKTRDTEKTQKQFPLSWSSDRSISSTRLYKGYESGYKSSEVSGLPRLYYDRSKPFEKIIPFFDTYHPTAFVEKPSAYIMPQGWWRVAELLKANKVKFYPLQHDTVIQVEVYKIEEYKSSPRPYEKHHPNSQVKTSITTQNISFRKGDLYIPMNQVANRYLMEVLEPAAPDSYFAWNFFDSVLGQKEGYSAYAFEDIAADYLTNHPAARLLLDEAKLKDSILAKSGSQQLEFIFKNSPWFEPAYMRYPVYRVR